ncbi:NADH-dependent alcohol dehydrogenase, partial [Vibrio rotiferianus]
RKLEQMGRNVFGLAEGEDLAERTIQAIEAFYHQLGVATQLEEYGDDREAAIDSVIARLNKHGMTVLGENQAIDLENSRKILDLAVA